jgi:hypothetical protein
MLGDAAAFWTMHQDQRRAQQSARNATDSEVEVELGVPLGEVDPIRQLSQFLVDQR